MKINLHENLYIQYIAYQVQKKKLIDFQIIIHQLEIAVATVLLV